MEVNLQSQVGFLRWKKFRGCSSFCSTLFVDLCYTGETKIEFRGVFRRKKGGL